MEAKTRQNINIGIVALCVIAFIPVLKAEFVSYDDPEYILNNPYIKHFSFQNIIAIFKGKATLLYVPLTHLSYMLETLVFGSKAFSFHLINLLLHIANCLLLFKILQRLNIKNIFTVLFMLIFFSISPLISESVAWATERKDVLYCLFYFLSAYRFLGYLESGKTKELIYSFLFFILACFSKPMAVTLPALLLVYVIYKYGKNHKAYSLKLIPFFIAALVFSLLAFYMVNTGKIPGNENSLHYGITEKIGIAFAALGFYFLKPFMPWNQQVIYLFPSPDNLMQNNTIFFYAIAGVGLLSFFIYSFLKKENRILHALYSCWLILMIPLLQLDTNNHSYVNERYLYISIIFPAAIVFMWLQHFNLSSSVLKNGTIVLAILFTLLTFRRSLAWKNSYNLFTQELKSEPGDPYALNNLGHYYNSTGAFQKGGEAFFQAMQLKPGDPIFLNNYGWSLSELGQMDSAASYFEKALSINEEYVPALNNIGVIYSKKKMLDRAEVIFKRSYKLDPNNGETNYLMGAYLDYTGHRNKAQPYYVRAAQLGYKVAEGK